MRACVDRVELMMMTFGRTILLMLAVLGGCAVYPKGDASRVGESFKCWKVREGQTCDYYQYFDEAGRVVKLGYDDDGDGDPEVQIDLRDATEDWPHYVILLDGIPFEIVKELYDEGHFRMFHQPSKLITCFPSMTDLAYSQLFLPGEVFGCEALWFDRKRNALAGGKAAYLNATNAAWQAGVDYRVPMVLDAVGYVFPSFVFNTELDGFKRTVDRRRRGTTIVYSVGTATIGTRKGRSGIVEALKKVEQFCRRLVYERRGRCRITILADHGHNLTASKHFKIADAVKAGGFRPTKRLGESGDVVVIEFGLVTFSAIYTDQAEGVADALLTNDPVELVMYRDQGKAGQIVVRSGEGLARVGRGQNGFTYEVSKGDPLELLSIIEKLKLAGKVTVAGQIDDVAMFEATADHRYPDPLFRVYVAFNGLVKNPPDLMVSVRDGWFCGASDLAGSVDVVSTHGSLGQTNSATFVMSTIRELPRAVRISELLEIMPEIRR